MGDLGEPRPSVSGQVGQRPSQAQDAVGAARGQPAAGELVVQRLRMGFPHGQFT
jgi:hypothetical protein